MCGGVAEVLCGTGEYCDYEVGQCPEEVADLEGACKIIPDACTADVMPVCGCDGMTYSNACQAAMAGVSIKQAGECPPR